MSGAITVGMRDRLALAAILLALTGLVGCFNGALGAACEGESDCDFGLRCLEVSDSAGVCTYRCDDPDACDQGTCLLTEMGPLCVQSCTGESEDECDGSLRCTEDSAARRGCFVPSPILRDVDPGPTQLTPEGAGRVQITGFAVVDDDNGDLALSAGESATIEVYVSNPGVDQLVGVWSEAVLSDMTGAIEGDTCYVRSSYCESFSGQACSCQGTGEMTLNPGEVREDAAIRLFVDLGPDASGSLDAALTFGNDLGPAWFGSISVPIIESGSNLGIAYHVIQTDSNENEVVNPGESVTLEIFAINGGSNPALSVWGSATVPTGSPFEIETCYAASSYCESGSGGVCSCFDTNATNLEIPGGTVGERGVFRLFLDVLPANEMGPGTYPIEVLFGDRLGNTWTDTLEVVVEATTADVSIDRVEYSGPLVEGSTTPVEIFVTNSGTSNVLSLRGEATKGAGSIEPDTCYVGSSYCSSATAGSCSCLDTNSSLDVEAGQTSERGVMRVFVEPNGASTTTTYDVRMVDAQGNEWNDTFTLP